MTNAPDYGLRPAAPQDLTAIMHLERAGFAPALREREAVFLERMTAFPEGFLLLEQHSSHQCLGYICSELWDFEEAPDPTRPGSRSITAPVATIARPGPSFTFHR